MLGVYCVAGYEAAGNNEHRAEKVPPQSKLNDSRGEKTDRQSGKGYEGGQGKPIWTTDISYIKTAKEGFFYLITYIDTYSRAVVGWGLESTQTARQVISVLDSAVKHRNPPPGLIIHSDKGSQMRSWEYRGYLKKHKFIASYTSLDHSCDENAAHESFHALIKKECIYLKKPDTYGEAYSMIHEYIDNFYNPVRIHSSLNYLSPLDFEAVYL